MFEDALRARVGQQVQIVTPMETISGILIAVTNGSVVVRTTNGYGQTEDVAVPINAISYARFFE